MRPSQRVKMTENSKRVKVNENSVDHHAGLTELFQALDEGYELSTITKFDLLPPYTLARPTAVEMKCKPSQWDDRKNALPKRAYPRLL